MTYIFTQADISDLLEYKDGKLFYKRDTKHRKKGDEWGCVKCSRTGWETFHGRFKDYILTRNVLVWILHNGPYDNTEYAIVRENGDGLDDRIENLKMVPKKEKNHYAKRFNKTGYRGVQQDNENAYYVKLHKNNKMIFHGGPFTTAEEAARVYDRVARRVYGENAYQNFSRNS